MTISLDPKLPMVPSVRNIKVFLLASKFRYILYIILILVFLVVWTSAPSIANGVFHQLSATNPKYDHIAIALKTGKDVALQRTLIQLLTFLKPVKNKIIIGDANMTIGVYQMFDVIQQQLHKREQEELKPNEASLGWANDAKKNIQGFELLYNHFPNAEWFFMIDDDTYVLMENLRWFLRRYDPSTPYYFGVATLFKGCDGVKELGKGPLFAHGGSGIVISRGALLKMLEIKESCLKKYDTCWAGDIRVALCLRDAEITLTHSPRFHGKPPNDHSDFQHPCSRPITFHHLLPHHTQKLHKIEAGGNKRLADIAPHFLNENILAGFERDGRTYKSMTIVSPDGCKRRCRLETKCLSYSFKNGICQLKNEIPSIRKEKDSFTGVLLEHYECFWWQQIMHI